MLRFKLEPQFSSSWTERLADRFRFRQGTYHIPVLGADEGNVSHLDTPVPQDAGLQVPLKPQKPVCQQNFKSRLLQLPPELLIDVMLHLPYSSLYMVRQTCQVLRNLTDDFQFEWFQWEILQHEHVDSWTTTPVCYQLRDIKRIFLRRSLCIPCGNLFDSGVLEERLKNLWQPVYCTRCLTDHPELFFPQGGRARNICVGLLGTFNLCEHVKVSGKVEVHDGTKVEVICSHPDHFPKKMNPEELSSFNGFRPHIKYDRGCLRYSRSFPLVKIAPQQYPRMSALKSRLFKQLKDKHQYELCQHGPTQLDSIVSSLSSDKCDCFPITGLRHCCDNHFYDCRLCYARYSWSYVNDCIVLHVSIDLSRRDGHSMGWLSNITFYTDERPIHPILNESTKGVLWCTDPSCGTGCGNRLLLMLELLNRFSLQRARWEYPVFAANLPYTLEYQVFQNAAQWMTRPDMLEYDLFYFNAAILCQIGRGE